MRVNLSGVGNLDSWAPPSHALPHPPTYFHPLVPQVMRIDAIPSKSLETIKDWLTSVRIKYYECKLNLAWKPVLKSIVEDPEGFIEQGGWEFLNMEVCVCVCVVGG